MCEVCKSVNAEGNPAQAASRLLDDISNALGRLVNAGAAAEYPDDVSALRELIPDLDLLCMEHLQGEVTTDERVEGKSAYQRGVEAGKMSVTRLL